MACSGCGAKYRRVNSTNRAALGTNPKYSTINKVLKRPKKPVKPASTPKTIDPQTAIGLLSSITSSGNK